MKLTKLLLIGVMLTILFVNVVKESGAFTTKEECLVTGDIGKFTYDVDTSNLANASGVVGQAGHFNKDHIDTICTGEYYNLKEIEGLPDSEARSKIIAIDVQVTQHAGADSDQWLLHEVESSFRGREKEGWLGQGLRGSTSIREINGNKIFDYGNIDYRWISNNVVIYIHYTDLEGTKPEPLEIVQAYLTKFPPTIHD